ncbi:adenosylcobinamide-GDP ribazoletransferase [Chlorobaculum sp. MV4-Y]|uniref:adenosylcobinamide-GDP ribazoletransferase n=1 Tax=Chlorobaculum sp. MV4-Y TaxID=2976335 RepID=UPI0021AF0772|nr:adenosylcobinamide-GDP ribazoletransferase [Chlorobaculum sp. MV4-Y]UWX58415.1 adenosylcobinamide-GDP ribazoletransferase [Chlorobaculum sp. MV4-Y]
MVRGLVTALRTLTILPVPGREAERYSDSLYWFPLAGLLIGTLETLLARLGVLAGWYEMAAMLALGGGIIFTRGLHADGLADFADGFFGGRNREASLRIMKDPNVGSFGSLALIFVMLFKFVCLLELVRYQAFGTMMAGVLLARMGQVLLASSLPYARAEGGTATAFVEGAGWQHLVVAIASAFVLLLYPTGFGWQRALFLIASAVASTLALGLLSRRKIGGVTGDVLGACSELTEAFVWFAAVLSIRFPVFDMT